MNTHHVCGRRRPSAALSPALLALFAIGSAGCAPEPGGTAEIERQPDAEIYDEAYDVEGVETPTRSDIGEQETTGGLAAEAQDVTAARAQAELQAASDSSVAGKLEFVQDGDVLRVEGEITGLTPGLHGLHVHEVGDCSAPDASSAGEHFAPRSSEHGAPTESADRHHAGDLGNIVADEDGQAEIALLDDSLTLNGGDSIVGRAIVVHADADDLVSQPSGNSGDRVGCGVIERSERDARTAAG